MGNLSCLKSRQSINHSLGIGFITTRAGQSKGSFYQAKLVLQGDHLASTGENTPLQNALAVVGTPIDGSAAVPSPADSQGQRGKSGQPPRYPREILAFIPFRYIFVLDGNRCVLPDNITDIRPFPMKQRKR